MSKRKRHPKKGGRVTPKGARPAQWSEPSSNRWHSAPPEREPELVVKVRRALSKPTPYDLLGLAASVVEALTERPHDRGPFGTREPDAPAVGDMVASLIAIPEREPAALLRAMVPLLCDDVDRQRLTERLATEQVHGLPRWIDDVSRVEVTSAVALTDAYGDGENLMIEAHWGTSLTASIVAFVDHNMGSLLKDCFVVPEPLTSLRAEYDRHIDRPDLRWESIDPADLKAHLLDALRMFDMTVPPIETDSWPMCRPILEQVMRTLPDGGTGYAATELDEVEREALIEAFLDSPHATPIAGNPDAESLVEPLFWFATSYGPGDPLRWSPTAVEIVLTDWFPRKVFVPPDELVKLPAVLRCLIRYAHAQQGLRPELTLETLGAVDRFEPDYLDLIGHDDDDPYDVFDHLSHDERMALLMQSLRDDTAASLGGWEVAHSLDEQPLPDEPFDWSVVPDDLHDRVREILEVADRVAEELVDIEFRTATRRLLARIAERSPDALRRRGRSDIWAAALVDAIARENRVTCRARKIHGTTVARAAGVNSGSVGQKVDTVYKAAHLTTTQPALLHSQERAAFRRRLGLTDP